MITWKKLIKYHRDMSKWILDNFQSEFIKNKNIDIYYLERMYAQRHASFISFVHKYGFIRIGCVIDDILITAEYEHTGKILSCCERCPFFTGKELCCYPDSLYGTLREEGINGLKTELVLKSILELKPREDIKELYKLYIGDEKGRRKNEI